MDMFKEPPNMLSAKDVTFVHDLLKVILTYCKKIRYYENRVQDEKIKKDLREVHKSLSKQYKHLLEVIS